MLQFPPWKVLLILAVLIWGGAMALPNVLNMSGAPGFVPKEGVNLGLDLRGGVYLEMEIRPEDVIGGQLSVFARDIRSAFGRTADQSPIYFEATMGGRVTSLRLQPEADGTFRMDEALQRLQRINPAVEGGLAGGRSYDIQQAGPDTIRIGVSQASEDAMMEDALRKTMTIVRRRVDPDGVAEISLTPSGNSRIVLEAPGEPDPQRLRDLLSRDGRMTFNLIEEDPIATSQAVAGVVRPGHTLLTGPGYGPMLVRDIPEIVGSDIATASQGNDERNRPQINFRLNANGARKFYETTRLNSNKLFAIVLDDVIMSAPRINEPIAGGNVRITGDFSLEEAQDLAAIIAAGEMPAKLQFLDQRVVSPTLGQDSINAGLRASIIGLALVALFMLIAYNLIGTFAVVSLMVNIILIFGALSGIGATLTLPGIAGIILTIGMAVDANVLVFERIREEQQNGRSILTAIQAGYERALSTILDANITTLIAALILYMLGSGPVKGFAVTLGVGIITSVFTAFVVTRWFTVMYVKAFRPKSLAI